VSLEETRAGRARYLLADVVLPPGGIDAAVRAFCHGQGIAFFDLLPALATCEEEHRGALYLNDDGHWTAVGHACVAAALDEFVTGQTPHRSSPPAP
jgi:hypothetical protein